MSDPVTNEMAMMSLGARRMGATLSPARRERQLCRARSTDATGQSVAIDYESVRDQTMQPVNFARWRGGC
jgi:hypothetical protein